MDIRLVIDGDTHEWAAEGPQDIGRVVREVTRLLTDKLRTLVRPAGP